MSETYRESPPNPMDSLGHKLKDNWIIVLVSVFTAGGLAYLSYVAFLETQISAKIQTSILDSESFWKKVKDRNPKVKVETGAFSANRHKLMEPWGKDFEKLFSEPKKIGEESTENLRTATFFVRFKNPSYFTPKVKVHIGLTEVDVNSYSRRFGETSEIQMVKIDGYVEAGRTQPDGFYATIHVRDNTRLNSFKYEWIAIETDD